MFDERIVPGAWVETRFGKAVCIEVGPHHHRLGPPQFIVVDGITHCACEDDTCKDEKWVYYRYRSRRYLHGEEGEVIGLEPKDIWVANGDLGAKFLSPPTRFTARILKLEGPYGEGKPACGPYIFDYCACGELLGHE